jgi:hypothetical protein
MAKLPRRGVGYQSLYEDKTTLPEVVATLGLEPLSEESECELRVMLGLALAQWEEPYTDIQVKDVVTALNAQAKRLDGLAPLAAVARCGFCRGEDIAVSGHLVQVLASNPTISNVEAAHAYLSEFCDRAQDIASACRAAAKGVLSTRGKSGRSRYDWYDQFTAALVELCNQNQIEPSAGIDPISDEPIGGLCEVASEFERLLLPKMRSPTPAALVKRLQRSLKRIRERS